MLKKIGIVCGVFVLIVIIGSIASPSKKAEDKNSTQTNQSETAEVRMSAIKKADVDGFSKPTITNLSDGYSVASYLDSTETISITITDKGNLSQHDNGRYNTDRGIENIGGVEVTVGYSTPDESTAPYQSLAFDFKLEDFTYSGEISHLALKSGESGNKQKLQEILTQFINAIK